MGRVRIAVAGAGQIGLRHIQEVQAGSSTELAAVVDPAPIGAELARDAGVAAYRSLGELFAAGRPDGVILATPNRMHVPGGLECVAAGVPTLVEKPIGDTVENATRLVEAAEAAQVPLLTGQHRRYSPIVAAAAEVVRRGTLGSIVAVVGTALFHKPDDYFATGWRRQAGGGPILLNLIHEVSTLLALVGDIVSVQATSSRATRGLPVEDTTAVIFQFAGGALGTFMLSDTAASPLSWEQTSGENARYAMYGDEDCCHIVGTNGSLSIPTMRLRTFPGARSWHEPFATSTVPVGRADPLAAQIEHFAAVIRGAAEPKVSGRDGLAALRVIEAVTEAADTGHTVTM